MVMSKVWNQKWKREDRRKGKMLRNKENARVKKDRKKRKKRNKKNEDGNSEKKYLARRREYYLFWRGSRCLNTKIRALWYYGMHELNAAAFPILIMIFYRFPTFFSSFPLPLPFSFLFPSLFLLSIYQFFSFLCFFLYLFDFVFISRLQKQLLVFQDEESVFFSGELFLSGKINNLPFISV